MDTGIGISDEDKPNIFQPFFKSNDSKSKEYNAKSNGLGLSICKQIALGLGGQITFESIQNMQTTF